MKNLFLLTIPVCLLLASCSSSKITTSWVSKDAQVSKGRFNKVLVMGLLSNKNRSSNISMEQYLAQGLVAKGIQAESATAIFGPKAFNKLNEQQAISKMKKDNIDAVITITLIDKAKQQEYVSNWNHPYFSWWGYYSFWSPFMWDNGYIRSYSSYTFETNLYDLNSKKQLIYSAHSETTSPSSPKSLGKDYAKSIVNDMIDKGIL